MTTAWHVPSTQLDRYLAGRIDDPSAASIEAHLLACGECRSALASHHAAPAVDRSWERLERAIDDELTVGVERLAVGLGVPLDDARVLAPNRALRLSWLVALAAALGCVALLSRRSGGDGGFERLVFLTLAPLAPLAAVVTALGASSEPAADIARAAPASRLRIAALRASTVMVVSIAVGLAASALLPGSWLDAVVWLCPALALAALGTVAAGRLDTSVTIGILGGGWVTLVVVASRMTDDRLAAFRPGPLVGYLVVATIIGLGVAVFPSSFQFGRVR